MYRGLLAKTPAVRLMRDGVFGVPSDVGKWKELIDALTEHIVKRYGNEKVRHWLFCTVDFTGFYELWALQSRGI